MPNLLLPQHPHYSPFIQQSCLFTPHFGSNPKINQQNHIHYPRLIRWWFPPFGFLKLNTDGSVKKTGVASFGGLIRNHQGRWVRGYFGRIKTKVIPTPQLAEIWAIHHGLWVIKDLGLRGVIIESDCKNAIELIAGRQESEDEVEATLIGDCQVLISYLGCSLIHTLREGNFCADRLANMGGDQLQELVLLDEAPSEVINLLLADSLGFAYEREKDIKALIREPNLECQKSQSLIAAL